MIINDLSIAHLIMYQRYWFIGDGTVGYFNALFALVPVVVGTCSCGTISNRTCLPVQLSCDITRIFICPPAQSYMLTTILV